MSDLLAPEERSVVEEVRSEDPRALLGEEAALMAIVDRLAPLPETDRSDDD